MAQPTCDERQTLTVPACAAGSAPSRPPGRRASGSGASGSRRRATSPCRPVPAAAASRSRRSGAAGTWKALPQAFGSWMPRPGGRAEPADREPIRPQPKGVRHKGFGVQVAGIQHDSPSVAVAGHVPATGSSRECRMFPPIDPCLARRGPPGSRLDGPGGGGNDEADGADREGRGFAGKFARFSGRTQPSGGFARTEMTRGGRIGIRPVPILPVFLERIPSQEAITV